MKPSWHEAVGAMIDVILRGEMMKQAAQNRLLGLSS